MNLSIDTINNRPDLYNQTIDLIERSLHYKNNNKYEIDFHPLINSRNHQHCHIIIEQHDGVVGHIGFIQKELSISNQSIPIILIGGVCIDKKYQGQGLSQKFFKGLIEKYKQKCALLVLWSDLKEFYEKLHFYECGEIRQTGTKHLDQSILQNYFLRDWTSLTDDEFLKIENLRRNTFTKSILLKRNHQDWADIQQIKSAKLFLAEDSYFVINKGQDLDGIIHEFGAVDSAKFVEHFHQYPLWLYDVKILAPKVHTQFFMGFFSIGQHDFFQKLVFEISNGEITDVELIQSSRILFSHQDRKIEMSYKDFLQSLLGPKKISEFRDYKSIIISGLESV